MFSFFATTLAIAFLGESLEFHHIAGVALISLGIRAATSKRHARRGSMGHKGGRSPGPTDRVGNEPAHR